MILRIWLDCVIFAIIILSIIFVVIVVQSLSHVQLFETPWTAAHQTSPSLIISQSLLKFMSIESVMPWNHLILCCPLLLLPSIFPSIRVFPVNQFFASGGQSIGASASASVLPMNIQGWFPSVLTNYAQHSGLVNPCLFQGVGRKESRG